MFFLLIEGVLRVADYGYPTAFFIPSPHPGYSVPNGEFAGRFMPRALLRDPVPFCLSASKPQGTYRIFVLGASAAQGWPSGAQNFGRIIEVLLEDRYPGVDFEVINTGISAINSHAVACIARECAELDPDMFLLYLGNNEVLGPFGPGTAFLNEQPSRPLIRANLRLRETRTGQLLFDTINAILPQPEGPSNWQGMEMFVDKTVDRDAPALRTVYENFAENLEEIADASASAGAEMLACTVAVNMTDCPPFVSLHRPDLSDDQLERWKSIYERAIRHEQGGQAAQAEAGYRDAMKIDPHYAELHYRLAGVLAGTDRMSEARVHYREALELDALRFRADAAINGAIRDLCASRAGSVHLVDVEKAFEDAPGATAGLPGGQMFYEHVHFTFEGNYRLARCVLDRLEPLLPERIHSRRQAGPFAEVDRCAEMVPMTDLNRIWNLKNFMMQMDRPPFTGQAGHAKRYAMLQKEYDQLTSGVSRAQLEQMKGLFADAVQHSPRNVALRLNYADLLAATGDLRGAIAQFEEVLGWMPRSPGVMLNVALARRLLGEYGPAEALYIEALRISPSEFGARLEYAQTLLLQNRLEDAAEQLEQARALRPNSPEVHELLGEIDTRRRNWSAAVEHFRRGVEIDPKSVSLRVQLAGALAAQGQATEAVRHLQRVRSGNPDYLPALRQLAWILSTSPQADARDGPEAVTIARKVCYRTGFSDAGDLDILAAALAETAQYDLAIKTAQRALAEARASGDTRRQIDVLTARMELYRKHQPYRQP